MTMAARGHAKLIEEMGELIQVCGKRLAYFRNEDHPDEGPPLRQRLADEMADVIAAINFVMATEGLSMEYIANRVVEKHSLFIDWHVDPNNNTDGVDSTDYDMPLGMFILLDSQSDEAIRFIADL